MPQCYQHHQLPNHGNQTAFLQERFRISDYPTLILFAGAGEAATAAVPRKQWTYEGLPRSDDILVFVHSHTGWVSRRILRPPGSTARARPPIPLSPPPTPLPAPPSFAHPPSAHAACRALRADSVPRGRLRVADDLSRLVHMRSRLLSRVFADLRWAFTKGKLHVTGTGFAAGEGATTRQVLAESMGDPTVLGAGLGVLLCWWSAMLVVGLGAVVGVGYLFWRRFIRVPLPEAKHPPGYLRGKEN